jgi:SAM-dependent methyltransferase
LNNWYRDASLAEKRHWYGSVAEAYDRTRPGYSQKFIDRIVEVTDLNANSRILEIGCGPGTATKSFANLNCEIIALEPNPEACQLAKHNCRRYAKVEIINSTFEEWVLPVDRFDVAMAATSFHWIDPHIACQKIFRALKESGYLILLWNTPPQIDPEFYRDWLREVYQLYTPSLPGYEEQEQNEGNLKVFSSNIVNSGYFKHLTTEKAIYRVNYSIDDYIALLSTLSPYLVLENQLKAALFSALKQKLQNYGNTISLSYLSVLEIFQKKSI